MKTCSKCNQLLSRDMFYKNVLRQDGYQSACKTCADAMNRLSRAKNPTLYAELHKAQRDKNGDIYFEWKSKQKCLLCSENVVECLDLHHLDPTTKETTISDVMRGWTWSRLQVELEKCVVLCSNCHAKVHAGILVV